MIWIIFNHSNQPALKVCIMFEMREMHRVSADRFKSVANGILVTPFLLPYRGVHYLCL